MPEHEHRVIEVSKTITDCQLFSVRKICQIDMGTNYNTSILPAWAIIAFGHGNQKCFQCDSVHQNARR